ncbi:unnamed protein product [Caenorhabditis bovis]|uniref:Uncharacterized protein n=1 Tax=Caenorhabditis bovis TaxID=2654633 RepID=A0A8S1F6C6_9PELO|nr:unnamed protein product [Caenorhabditis bovis]
MVPSNGQYDATDDKNEYEATDNREPFSRIMTAASEGCCKLICNINVKIGWTICGIILGFIYIACYIFYFKNWSACIVCAISVVFAFMTLYLYWAYKKDWIVSWKHSTFFWMFWLNIIFSIFALAGLITCYIIAGIDHMGAATIKDMHGENLWFTGTWFCFIIKWTVQSAFFARSVDKSLYRNQIEIDEEDGDTEIIRKY